MKAWDDVYIDRAEAANIEASLMEIEMEIPALSTQISTLEEEISTLETEEEGIQAQITTAESEPDYENDPTYIQLLINLVRKQLELSEKEAELSEKEAEFAAYQSTLSTIRNDMFVVGDVDISFESSDMIEGSQATLPWLDTEYLYFGLDRTFDGIFLEIEQGNGDYVEYPKHEYWNGEWKQLPLQHSLTFRESSVSRFPIQPDWEKGGGNDVKLYYVRVQGSNASGAKMVDSFPFPSYAYTSPEEVNRLMALRVSFSEKTNPSEEDVIRIIQRIEGRIEGYTTVAWKPQYRENEDYEFNKFGLVLKRFPVIKLFEISLWEGGSYRPLTQGRDNDYFLTPRTGLLNFGRFIHLPFAYSRTRAYGFGEYRFPLRTRYIWGKDIDLDDRGYMVKDVAAKLVAADVYSTYDLTAMIPQGTDRFGIDARIDRWTDDAEEAMENLRPLRVWLP